MEIVFNINPLGLVGFGSTLSSLIRNCSNSSILKIYILSSGLEKNDKKNIIALLKIENYAGEIEFIEFNAKAIFGHLRSLHGDWTAYGRLLIADYVQSDYALYLDSDLIVYLDILKLKDFSFEEQILAAVSGGEVRHQLESSFFLNKLNWIDEQCYFNSGVVLFNLKKWRSLKIETKWKRIGDKFPNELLSADQTLLNAVCDGEFAILPPIYNNPWYPSKGMPLNAENSIIHFVGSPKPWDILGSVIHKGYIFWKAYNHDFWDRKYGRLSYQKIKRTLGIKNSIIKHLLNNLKYYR